MNRHESQGPMGELSGDNVWTVVLDVDNVDSNRFSQCLHQFETDMARWGMLLCVRPRGLVVAAAVAATVAAEAAEAVVPLF